MKRETTQAASRCTEQRDVRTDIKNSFPPIDVKRFKDSAGNNYVSYGWGHLEPEDRAYITFHERFDPGLEAMKRRLREEYWTGPDYYKRSNAGLEPARKEG